MAALTSIGEGEPPPNASDDPFEKTYLGDAAVEWPGNGALASVYHN